MKPDNSSTDAVEARLERSLRRQVVAPKLDGRFDAAVWSRIAEEDRAVARPASRAPSASTRMPRWLVACNALGIAVTVIVLAWFGATQLTGIDVGVGVELEIELPRMTAEQQLSWLMTTSYIVAGVAVLFGLKFTRLGRRLLSTLR